MSAVFGWSAKNKLSFPCSWAQQLLAGW